MKRFNGYEEAKKAAQYTPGEKLPAGAYVCKIMKVEFINGQNGNSDSIKVYYDIIEGDQKDFFRKQYDANTSEDKKWKGTANIYVPKDDGSEKDGWTKNSFAKWTNSFEESNAGYTWDWDENKWKGLVVGVVYGETGNVIEGREVTYTEARFACSVKDVREGKAPKAKALKKNGFTGNGSAAASASSAPDMGFVNVPEGTAEELPF